jgi:hypothetical protein
MKPTKITPVLMVCFFATPLVWAKDGCREPVYENFTHKNFSYGSIDQSGNFCLNRNLYAPKVYRWLEGAEEDLGSPLLLINASHVVVDIKEHEINKQWKGYSSAVLTYATDPKRNLITDVHVKNGTIIHRMGIGYMASLWGYDADWPLLYRYAGQEEDARLKKFVNPIAKYLALVPEKNRNKDKRSILAHAGIKWVIDRKDLTPFPVTRHILENLKIEANGNEKDEPFWNQDLQGSQGIVIRGAQNIIRNCTIEVTHTDAGIYLFGPNQVIENNTIIFKGHLPQGMSAPIRLSLADGSIIRNNTIIVQSEGANKPAAAISLIDSRNVVIENNTIEGVETIYRSWDELPEQKTSVQEKDNRFKKGWRLF